MIPTRNREELLGRCLEALRRQTESSESFEVVVVDDGSTDGTAKLLAKADTPFALRPLRVEPAGVSSARNAGVAAAAGGICIFLDDDCIPAPALVAEHLAAHREDDRLLAIGALTQVPPGEPDWYTRAFARAWEDHYRRMEGKPAAWSDCYSGNISVPREAMIELGGFATDVPVGEDIELGFRLEQRGFALRYLPRAGALHDDQKPRRRLLADVRRHAGAYLELSRRHPGMEPKLIGWFADAGPRELALRRLLIALRVPVGALAGVGALVPGEARQSLWYDFVWRFAFWRQVRRLLSRREWLALSRRVAPERSPSEPVGQP